MRESTRIKIAIGVFLLFVAFVGITSIIEVVELLRSGRDAS